MKKIINSKFFYFLLGTLIAGGISVVFAYSLIANDVGFVPHDSTWEVDNVKDALDDLRSKKNALYYNMYLDGVKKNFIPSNEYFFSSIECENNTSTWDIGEWTVHANNVKDNCNVYFNSFEERLTNQTLIDIFTNENYNKQIFLSSKLKEKILFDEEYRNTLLSDSNSIRLLDNNAVTVPILSNDTNVLYGSRYDGNYSGFRAFDGNDSTRFASPSGRVNGNYIGYNFNKNISVYKVYWLNPTLNENIVNFKIQYYDESWKDATSTLTAANRSNSGTNTIYLDKIYTSSQWRIYIISSTSGSYVNVATVQFYGLEP